MNSINNVYYEDSFDVEKGAIFHYVNEDKENYHMADIFKYYTDGNLETILARSIEDGIYIVATNSANRIKTIHVETFDKISDAERCFIRYI